MVDRRKRGVEWGKRNYVQGKICAGWMAQGEEGRGGPLGVGRKRERGRLFFELIRSKIKKKKRKERENVVFQGRWGCWCVEMGYWGVCSVCGRESGDGVGKRQMCRGVGADR